MPIVGHPRLLRGVVSCTFRIAEGHEAVAHGKPPLAPGTSDGQRRMVRLNFDSPDLMAVF